MKEYIQIKHMSFKSIPHIWQGHKRYVQEVKTECA